MVAVAIHPLFFRGFVPHSYDMDSFYAPSWEFLAHSLRSGTLPQWNPFVFGGAPFTGDPQSQALYPPTLVLFGVLSLPAATVAWFAFHYLVAASGTFRLARNLMLGPRAAAFAAVTFAASTYLVARVQSPTLLAGAAWMPVVLAATVGGGFGVESDAGRLINSRLALAFALQILSGSQQVLLLTAVACVVASLTLRSGRHVLRTIVGLALAALVAAPQLLPLASLVRGSTASGGIDVHGFGALSWGDRSILAGSFSKTASETAPIYAGVFGLGQALVALGADRKRRPIQLIAALGGLALVWSLGIVGRVVSVIFPPFATITAHQPVRAMPLAVLAVALGIGAYWDRVRRAPQIVAVVALSVAGFVVAGTLGPVAVWVLIAAALATLAAMVGASVRPGTLWPVVAFAVVLAADLAVHNVNLRNSHQPPAVWRPASSLYPPKPATAVALRHASAGLDLSRVAWLAPPAIREHQLSRAQTVMGRALLLNGGAMRYRLPVLSGYNPIINRSWAKMMDDSNRATIADRHFVYVIRAPTPLLRAYAVGAYICVRQSCPPTLPVTAQVDGLQLVLDAKALPFARITNGTHGPVPRLARWSTPQSIDVYQHHGSEVGGLVSVASRYAPGWHVTVDGYAASIVVGKFGEMEVVAPGAWQRIRFWYDPPGLQIGVLLALIGLAICGWRYVVRIARFFHDPEP